MKITMIVVAYLILRFIIKLRFPTNSPISSMFLFSTKIVGHDRKATMEYRNSCKYMLFYIRTYTGQLCANFGDSSFVIKILEVQRLRPSDTKCTDLINAMVHGQGSYLVKKLKTHG